MKIKKISNLKSGFTLVELLVVISIIGTLAGLLLINFVGVRGRAADAKSKNDLKQLKTALRLYYNDHQQFPASGSMPASGEFSEDGTIYMKDLPQGFTYTPAVDQDSYVLAIDLENASDEDIERQAGKCGQSYEEGDVTYYVCND
jgi:general secretion pathway protein G